MGTSPRIGCLVDDGAESEQSEAYEWCESRFDAVSRCRPDTFDPAEYDVLWWHRVDPVEPATVSESGPLAAFVRGGGSLLLTLAALTAVEPLGFDGVGPDALAHLLGPPVGGVTLQRVVLDRDAVLGEVVGEEPAVVCHGVTTGVGRKKPLAPGPGVVGWTVSGPCLPTSGTGTAGAPTRPTAGGHAQHCERGRARATRPRA